jgi:hypothetical protein
MQQRTIHCKNCGQYFETKFCGNCGQKEPKRFTFKNLMHEIPHQFLHIDGQIITNLKRLSVNPGRIVNDYIGGKRKTYFPPFTYLIIVLAVYFITFKYSPNSNISLKFTPEVVGQEQPALDKISTWVNNNTRFLIFFFIPIIAIASKLLFKKSKFNYSEHIIVSTFYIALLYQFLIVSNFIDYLVGSSYFTSRIVPPILPILTFFFYYSVFRSYYNKLWAKILLAILMPVCIAILVLVIVFSFIIIVSAIYPNNGVRWSS